MMMEQDAKRVRRQAPEPYSRNQEMMMEQDAKRVRRQPRNPSRNQEMMIGTLAGARKGWWNRMPEK